MASWGNLRDAARSALRSSSVFAPLPDAAVEELASFARLETYETSTLIVRAGEHPSVLRYVLKGYIVARTSNLAGYEAELVPIFPGEFSAWLGTFSNRPTVQDYWTSRDAAFIGFPNTRIIEICDHYPLVYKQALEHVAGRFQTILRWVWDASLAEGPIRLARQLLLYAAHSRQETDIHILVSQETLAKTLGWSRQTLNRQLRRLEEQGLVRIGYRQLTILHRHKLMTFSGHTQQPVA